MVVSDGTYELICYAQPFENSGDFVLHAFSCNNIVSVEECCFQIEKSDSGYFSYKLQGKVLNTEQGVVQIGNLIIENVQHIPKDISNGKFVNFDVLRIDLIESIK